MLRGIDVLLPMMNQGVRGEIRPTMWEMNPFAVRSRVKTDMANLLRSPSCIRPKLIRSHLASPHRGRNRTLRDSMSVPQLVFLPRAVIAGNAAIFSPRWTMKAS